MHKNFTWLIFNVTLTEDMNCRIFLSEIISLVQSFLSQDFLRLKKNLKMSVVKINISKSAFYYFVHNLWIKPKFKNQVCEIFQSQYSYYYRSRNAEHLVFYCILVSRTLTAIGFASGLSSWSLTKLAKE